MGILGYNTRVSQGESVHSSNTFLFGRDQIESENKSEQLVEEP
jgi:hypothetical protein